MRFSIFEVYLRLGMEHITDFASYDHILFLLTLCAIYQFQHWKRLLVLITAFTIGHSTTLALATFDLIRISSEWIEFVIPFTIFLTSIANLVVKAESNGIARVNYRYILALVFGLVHGLGFSNELRVLLLEAQSVVSPLLGFNFGVEIGQLLIVVLYLLMTSFLFYFFRIKARDFKLVLSGGGLAVSLILMLERFPI